MFHNLILPFLDIHVPYWSLMSLILLATLIVKATPEHTKSSMVYRCKSSLSALTNCARIIFQRIWQTLDGLQPKWTIAIELLYQYKRAKTSNPYLYLFSLNCMFTWVEPGIFEKWCACNVWKVSFCANNAKLSLKLSNNAN